MINVDKNIEKRVGRASLNYKIVVSIMRVVLETLSLDMGMSKEELQKFTDKVTERLRNSGVEND